MTGWGPNGRIYMSKRIYGCPSSILGWKQTNGNNAKAHLGHYPVIYWRVLSHLPPVPHICVSESDQHWFRQWLVACSAPSHYLNQCCYIVNWTFRNKLQWNLNRNTKLSIQENAYDNIVCEMAAILSSRTWVNMSVEMYDRTVLNLAQLDQYYRHYRYHHLRNCQSYIKKITRDYFRQ